MRLAIGGFMLAVSLVACVDTQGPSGTVASPGRDASQKYWPYLVHPESVKAIRVSLVPGPGPYQFELSQAWKDAAREAMAEINAIGGTTLRFVEANPPQVVVFGVLPYNNCDLYFNALRPNAQGKPGAQIIQNLDNCQYRLILQDPLVKKGIMIHGFLHTIGLDDICQTRGIQIPGTPEGLTHTPWTGCDLQSIMARGSEYGPMPWQGFSYYDVLAVRTMYPIPLPPSPIINGPQELWGDQTGTWYVSWSGFTPVNCVWSVDDVQVADGACTMSTNFTWPSSHSIHVEVTASDGTQGANPYPDFSVVTHNPDGPPDYLKLPKRAAGKPGPGVRH